MSSNNQKTIFVSIASYRDPDCINTVESLLENAVYPERVFMGICWQFVPKEEPALLQLFEYQDKIRQVSLPARFSRGPCLARHLAQQLWQGEDYYFQIDSHMRFVPGWDEKLLTLLGQCPSSRPVLSTYPLAYTPGDSFARDALVKIRPRYFDEQGVLHQHSALITMPDQPPEPSSAYFISAGMLFAPGRVIREVPYDPHIYFAGEEISLALRLWTHGWDIFNPNAVIGYHNYQKDTLRKRHWEDQAEWSWLNRISTARVRFLTGQSIQASADSLMDMDKYGLGSFRTVKDYQIASGLDFAARTWHGKSIKQS
ncbi:MAG: GlcNAc-transferase family protein [Desulfonatronovibrio sp.]